MSAISKDAEPKGEDTVCPAVFEARFDRVQDVLQPALPVGLMTEEEN